MSDIQVTPHLSVNEIAKELSKFINDSADRTFHEASIKVRSYNFSKLSHYQFLHQALVRRVLRDTENRETYIGS